MGGTARCSSPVAPRRWFDEPLVAELLIVSDISGEADAACIETLARQSMGVVRDVVLEKIPANLPVDEKISVACSAIHANKRDLEAVAKTRGRIKARSGVVRLRSQVADRRAEVQIPPVHIQSGKVGADLNAGEIFQRVRIANDVALLRPTKAYVSGRRGCANTEVAANAAGPNAATFLVRLRIGWTPDQRTRLRQERGVRGIDRRNKGAHRCRHVRNSHDPRVCHGPFRDGNQITQANHSALSLRRRRGKQSQRKRAGPGNRALRPYATAQYC